MMGNDGTLSALEVEALSVLALDAFSVLELLPVDALLSSSVTRFHLRYLSIWTGRQPGFMMPSKPAGQ